MRLSYPKAGGIQLRDNVDLAVDTIIIVIIVVVIIILLHFLLLFFLSAKKSGHANSGTLSPQETRMEKHKPVYTDRLISIFYRGSTRTRCVKRIARPLSRYLAGMSERGEREHIPPQTARSRHVISFCTRRCTRACVALPPRQYPLKVRLPSGGIDVDTYFFLSSRVPRRGIAGERDLFSIRQRHRGECVTTQ